MLVNSGAEAVENAVKIARAATGRPAVIAFDQAFHGRTLLALSLTAKVVPVQEVVRAVRARGLPGAVLVSVPRHRRRSRRRSRGSRRASTPSQIACVVVEPIAGEGGFVVPEPGWLAGIARVVHGERHRVRRRRGADRLRPHRRVVRERARRRRARSRRDRQGARRRHADRGRHRPGRDHGRGARRRPRQHVRRQSRCRARPRSPRST